MFQGDALKAAARQLATSLQLKVQGSQQGVGTFSDHVLMAFIAHLEQLDEAIAWEDSVAQSDSSIDRAALQYLQQLLGRRAQGRLVEYQVRVETAPPAVHGSSDIDYFAMVASQGAFECLQWKGVPLFKTVYDFSLYPMMLWDLKPRTIIELGSGTGASALWLADLAQMFGIRCHVHSVDLKKADVEHEHITFVEGDCETIAGVFDENVLRNAPHPWMVIEDAHVNVVGVLRHFHPHIRPGDYLVIEDSAGKQEEIRHFLVRQPGCYKVDTYYTDFFGRNATSAQDSILVRTEWHE